MGIAKITVWVDDQASLQTLLESGPISLECGAPRRDADGSFRVTLYGPKAEAQKLAARGFRVAVDEGYGAYLEQRQKEVSRKDRFKGGKVAPKGLGVKR